jgi:hypothetical protein
MPSARLRHAPSHTHASRARSCARGGNCTPLHPPAATPAVRPLYARCPPRCTRAAPPRCTPRCTHALQPATSRSCRASGICSCGARGWRAKGARCTSLSSLHPACRRPTARLARSRRKAESLAPSHGITTRPSTPSFSGVGMGGGARLWAGSILVRHAETAQSQVPQPDVRVRVGVMVRVRVRAKYPPTGRGVPLLGLTQRLRCRRVGASAHRR